jgi:DNA-binding MarR family transcriptional regulator
MAKRMVYQVSDFMNRVLANGSKNLVTRDTGKLIREAIESQIQGEPEGTVVVLDFSKVGIIDFSCAEEVMAKMIARLMSREYGDKYLLLSNLTQNQEENIHAALQGKKLMAMSLKASAKPRYLGVLNPYLMDTLELVLEKKSITARELADLTQVEINTASTKLLNLYKARLVLRERVSLAEGGGRQYVYRSLLES